MFTDMVGYTALGQRNEAMSLALVEEQRKVIRPVLARYKGREIKTIGDAFLVTFPNAVDAVRCAYDIQRTAREFNLAMMAHEKIHLRIGVHLGEVVELGGDVHGDAVNVASRIESLAEDGGVCVTRQVYDHVANKLELPLVSIGAKALKNVTSPVEVFKVELPWESKTENPPHPATQDLDRRRVAVLPFRSMSPDPDDEYFAEGMTEEIISTVSGISGLKVISRTSVTGYKGTTKNLREIGKELEVGSVLEGSLRKAGNKIRVTTQLIDVARDEHLWAQNYDRNLDDVFTVQSDVANHIAEALRVRILNPEKERIGKKPTEDTAAYELYLKGKHYLNKRGMDDLKKALKYFELAVHEDPDFALGYACISDCNSILRSNWGVEPEASFARAKEMVAKALEIDPGLAEAHASWGMLLHSEFDFRRAEEEFRKAIELKPSYSMAHMWYFILLNYQMRWDEAREQIEKALELDPLSPVIHLNYGAYYWAKRDYRNAIEPLKKAAELGFPVAHGMLGGAYGMLKEFEEMKREFALDVELLKDSVPFERLYSDAWMACLTGDKEALVRLLPEVESHFHDERGPEAFIIAMAYSWLGENAKAFEWLERSFSRREFALPSIQAEPFFDGIRGDPRYSDFLKKLGLK